jgi:hypothetical protein
MLLCEVMEKHINKLIDAGGRKKIQPVLEKAFYDWGWHGGIRRNFTFRHLSVS